MLGASPAAAIPIILSFPEYYASWFCTSVFSTTSPPPWPQVLDIFQFFQPDPGGHINGRVILEKADGLGFVLEEEKVRPCPFCSASPAALLASPLRHVPSGCWDEMNTPSPPDLMLVCKNRHVDISPPQVPLPGTT